MARRAGYMYGAVLARGPQGQVGAGLGQTTSTGTVTLIPPTVEITTTGQEEIVDGVRMVFQMTPGTEAPSEMNFYFPDRRALCMAENATHTLHNLLTLRGAVVRDPHVWSQLPHRGDRPVRWPGRRRSSPRTTGRPGGPSGWSQFLSIQRDLYGYLHDQTLRMLNKGLTGERDRRAMRCRRRWRARGPRTATTVRSVTTSRRSTSGTWAGSTATRRICGRIRRSRGPSLCRLHGRC